MDFFGGCTFCDKAVDCQIAGEPASDCPVEALEKAKADLKQAFEETRFFKAAVWMADKLAAFLESFHRIS